MKLVASLIVRNELDRYLDVCLDSLVEYVDEVAVLVDKGSNDGTAERLEERRASGEPIAWCRDGLAPGFFEHEGRARNALLAWTLESKPTHVLAIDADEIVSDGLAVRAACFDNDGDAWNLCMQEVWKASDNALWIRQDGGWVEHDIAILWSVPKDMAGPLWKLPDRALACGRVPQTITGSRIGHSCSAILHFGWTKQSERDARAERYFKHDGGRFHANAHLQSILLPDDAIDLTEVDWPQAFTNRRREAILGRTR